MKWYKILELIIYVLGKIKDSDNDGTIDLFDKEPNNPEVK